MVVRLSYHNWKLAACVESLKSIPMETVTEASGSSRSESGEEGRKDERRKGRVSDKGTVCNVGKDEAKGERRRRRRGGSSRVEQTGIHTTCVFYFTKQGHCV